MFTAISIFPVCALEITEIELNPPGEDTGAEWIEIYSQEQTVLDNLLFVNGDNQKAQVNGTFTGYYVLAFQKQWLDNSNESILIMNGEQLVVSVGPFKDDKNSDKTWSLCTNEWKFITQSKGAQNSCSTTQNITQPTPEITQNVSNQLDDNRQVDENITNQEKTVKVIIANNTQSDSHIINNNSEKTTEESVIRLNGKTINSENKTFISTQEKTRRWISYSFTFICLFIIIWLLVKS